MFVRKPGNGALPKSRPIMLLNVALSVWPVIRPERPITKRRATIVRRSA